MYALMVARCHKLWREQGAAEEGRDNVSNVSTCAAGPGLKTFHLTTTKPQVTKKSARKDAQIIFGTFTSRRNHDVAQQILSAT
jgi:hypothetical protein